MAGFTHARGPGKQREGIPASNFSEGDALVYDSSSSLSRAPVLNLSAIEVAGVARAASVDSVNDLVPYTRPTDEDVFFSELTATTVGSQVTVGTELDIQADGDGRHYSANSGTTTSLVCEEGTGDVLDQSVQSRVLVRFRNTRLEHD